jgi:hypothetical protein
MKRDSAAPMLGIEGPEEPEVDGNCFDEGDRQRVRQRLVRRLNVLGYRVTLERAA